MMKRAAGQRRQVSFSAQHLDAIDEYEPADLVISVQSGVTMNQIARATVPHNQFLALDPALGEDALIGAVVEQGAAGPLRFGHGTPRDQVLGIEIVAGDGRVLQFGGKVVKNVAGYDVVRLLVGSRGTLGFITRVHLRLKPIPAVDNTAIFAVDTLARAIEISDAIRASRLDAVALEIVSPPFMPRLSVLVRLHGNVDSVADAIERLPDKPTEVVSGENNWRAISSREAGAAVSIRMANLPSRLRATMQTARELEPLIEDAAFAIHAGDGIIRLTGSALAANANDAISSARERISAHGGSLIVERAPAGSVAEAFGRPNTLELMRQIKRVFDPAGILGAGSMAL